MKTVSVIILLIITLVICPIVNVQAQNLVVISGATVIDGTGRAPIKNAVIVIEGNRITRVGAKNKIKLPKNAEIIDAAGKFVIPGLADMHIHPGNGFFLRGSGGSSDFKKDFAQILAWGFTTVLSQSGPGLKDTAELQNFGNRDDSMMPRFFGVGPAFTVKGGHASSLGTLLLETPDEARAKVREMKAAGVYAVKLIYEDNARGNRPPIPMMKPEVMQAIIDEAHKQNLKAYVHALSLHHAKEALRSGADGFVHTIVSEAVDDEFIALMKKNRAVYITTHSLFNAFADIAAWMQKLKAMDERQTIPKEVYDRFGSPEGVKTYYANFGRFSQEQIEIIKTNLRKVHDAGILVVAGTDTGVPGVLLGASSQMELVLLTEAGLKPVEALQTATINAAKMLGREKEQGTIEAGKLADLVILEADPLADIRNIRRISRVVKSGVVYDPSDLLRATR